MAVSADKTPLVDIIWVGILTGTGVLIYTLYERWKSFRAAPIMLTNEPTGKMITVNIPEVWIPRSVSDTKSSVKDKYTPKVTIDGDNWVITLPSITFEEGGLTAKIAPPPVKVPLSKTMDVVTLAAKLAPTVAPTATPPGWSIKFPIVMLAA